jgi:DNA mismatch repair ATPase MutS
VNDVADLSFHYQLKHGCTQTKNYGLALARSLDFPDDILIKAAKVSQQVQDLVLAKKQKYPSREIQKHRLVVQTVERLRQLKRSGKIQGEELREYLKSLREPLMEFAADFQAEKS